MPEIMAPWVPVALAVVSVWVLVLVFTVAFGMITKDIDKCKK